MNNTKLQLAALAGLVVCLSVACGEEVEEIDSWGAEPDPNASRAAEPGPTGSTTPPSTPESGRVIDVSVTDTTEPVPAAKDAGAPPSPPLSFGCTSKTEIEPNDLDPQPLWPTLCGDLTSATDIDTFAALTGSNERKLSFRTTGDAKLEVTGYGYTRSIANNGELAIPALNGLTFTVKVKSASGAAQSYRIDMK